MSRINNPLEIYKFLPQSNCRQCSFHTCIAFADAVLKGLRSLSDCPYIDNNTIGKLEEKITSPMTGDKRQEQILKEFKSKIHKVDFPSSADRLGAIFTEQKLKIKSLGKNFNIDSEGNITSDCHLNRWIIVPLIDYVLNSKGKNISGHWISFRELKNVGAQKSFFEQRCEKPLQQIADANVSLLFENIISVFDGRPAYNYFSFDYSFILYPLPKVPVFIGYSTEKEDMHSKLNILFDATADDNLGIDSIHLITLGMVTMFEKIIMKHS